MPTSLSRDFGFRKPAEAVLLSASARLYAINPAKTCGNACFCRIVESAIFSVGILGGPQKNFLLPLSRWGPRNKIHHGAIFAGHFREGRISPSVKFKKQNAITLVVILVLVAGVILAAKHAHDTNSAKSRSVNNFADCIQAGFPVQESYPSVCRAPDGRSFTNPDDALPSQESGDTLGLPRSGNWCPAKTVPPSGAPCFKGTENSDHPGNYTFTPD